MFERLIRLLAPPAPVEELPDIFGKRPLPKVPKVDALPILANTETNTWDFVKVGKTAGSVELTQQDVQILESRNRKNHALNAQAKRLWARGDSAKEAAAFLGYSESMVEKIFACFSKSANEMPCK